MTYAQPLPVTVDIPGLGPVGPIGPASPAPTGPLTNIPTPGQLITYVGQGVQATWNDVWGYISGAASSAATDILNVEQTIGQAVLNGIEAYVGAELQALGGFINDAIDIAVSGIDGLSTALDTAVLGLYDDVVYLDKIAYGLLLDVQGIEGNIIPNIEQRLLDLGTATAAFIHLGIADVQTWAIDNIYNPLLNDVQTLERDTVIAIEGTATRVLDEARSLVKDEVINRTAAIAALATAVAAITTFVEECGQPMCDTFGPKTDLGKLFKALALAGELAALAELANMNEHDLAALLTTVGRKAATYIDFLETNFVAGGESIGATVTNAIASNI